MFDSKAISIIFLLALEACGPGAMEGETGVAEETTGYEGGRVRIWAETRCIEGPGGTPILMGRHMESDDAWAIVVDTDDLGMWDPAENVWPDESCAAGTHPSSVIGDVDCRETPHGRACFFGDGAFKAPVSPACQFEAKPVGEWPEGSCAGGAAVGSHPWDDIRCTDAPVSAACFGFSQDTMMLVYPTCWVESWDQSPDC